MTLAPSAGAGAVHVQALAAVPRYQREVVVVLPDEPPLLIGLRRARPLNDVGAVSRAGVRHIEALSAVRGPQRVVAAVGRDQIPPLIGLGVAIPLYDVGAVGLAGAVHVQALAAVPDHQGRRGFWPKPLRRVGGRNGRGRHHGKRHGEQSPGNCHGLNGADKFHRSSLVAPKDNESLIARIARRAG